MRKVRITVLKRHFDPELADAYGVKGIGACPFHKEGEVFLADYQKPERLCDEAWKAIFQYVFALSHSSGELFYGDWMASPDVAICCCSDGLRPVVFKLERTDEVSVPPQPVAAPS